MDVEEAPKDTTADKPMEENQDIGAEKAKDTIADKPMEDNQDIGAEKAEGAKAADQINGSIESVEADKKDAEPSPTNGEKEEEKKVHISAHQRERDERPSSRVKQGQRWNDRDRNKHNNDYKKEWKKNNKSELISQKESNDPIAIRKQVEFYFSDSNLLTDKFLFAKVEGHKNHPVPLEIIHSFKRMQHFQPRSAIVTALKESPLLDLVEDDTAIQRKDPLEEGLEGKDMSDIQKVYEDKTMARSIYAKGFGDEGSSTQFDIEAFFQNHGPTNSVRLRRSYDKTFKGSVFVEFDSEATQKDFLALDPAPKWKGKDLQIKSKKQYCDDKVEDIKAGRVRPNSQDGGHRGGYRGRGDRRDNTHRDLDKHDDRDWRMRRDEDSKEGFRDHGGRRGGRERGRGGRGGRRDDRDRGENNSKRQRSPSGSEDAVPTDPASKDSAAKPIDDTLAAASTASVTTDAAAKPIDDPAAAAPTNPATNDAPPAEESKKRAREDDEAEGQGSAKKVDVKEG